MVCEPKLAHYPFLRPSSSERFLYFFKKGKKSKEDDLMTGENYRKFKFLCLFPYCNCFHVSAAVLSGYRRDLRSSTPELFIICPFIETSLPSCLEWLQQILMQGPSLEFCVSEACVSSPLPPLFSTLFFFYIFKVPTKKNPRGFNTIYQMLDNQPFIMSCAYQPVMRRDAQKVVICLLAEKADLRKKNYSLVILGVSYLEKQNLCLEKEVLFNGCH